MVDVVTEDLEAVDGNKDVDSILKNIGNCNTTGRIKRWQYYNDAEFEGTCYDGTGNFIEVKEVIKKTCYVEDVAEVPAGTLTITGDDYFENLQEYIKDNFDPLTETCSGALAGTSICTFLSNNYTDECGEGLYPTEPCAEGDLNCIQCTTPTISLATNMVDQITGETVVDNEKTFATGYQKIPPPSQEYLYQIDTSSNTPQHDTATETLLALTDVYFRNSDFINEDCTYAKDINNVSDFSSNGNIQYFNNYATSTVLADLLSPKNTTAFTDFQNKVHKKALWFRVSADNRLKYILEISKQKTPNAIDDINISSSKDVRISIFKDCASTTAIYSEVISLNTGGMLYFEKSGIDLVLKDTAGTSHTIVGGWDAEYLVAIDNKIILSGANYVITPTDGVYTLSTRDIEVISRQVSWDSISIKKKIDYSSTCTFKQPVVQECTAVPFQYGKFAYWESRETYPDNQEMFNSTTLKISPSDIPLEYRTEFATTFTDGRNIDYILKDEVNFSCQPIRHFRFPDNKVSPFMYENTQAPFLDAPIFPLGVTINEELINAFLDIAVKNSLISQEKRNLIKSYEILRGDISLDRSVVSSGLLYDMRKYVDDGKDWYYSNYPYNDLGKDKLNLDTVDNLGTSNSKFTYHSPETDYNSITVPSELSVQGYSFGASKGQFDQVEDHAKWVILSKRARTYATTLATIEVATEIGIAAAQAASNAQVWAVGGIGSTGFSLGIPAFASAAAIGILGAIDGVVSRVGRYRYEWLQTFENLGRPENFAYYYYSKGHYNYTKQLQTEGDQLRGINRGLRIKNGDFTINNEATKERVNVNNTDREWTTFLDLGTSAIEYPLEYRTFDNNNEPSSEASLTYLSENGDCATGKSKEIQKNIASPYVALVNYNPNQYGTISSIKWLPTGYRGDLSNPQTGCLSIFGGDTFIAPHTFKRKIPLFLTTMFGAADFTPFNYKFYSNIGKTPKFYVDYKVLTEQKSGSVLFPNIDYTLAFDCENRDGNYYKSPSKFYLYYYGVPRFMTETRINTWNRTAEPTLDKDFYPNIGDINLWTQQKNVKIVTPNYYFYNNIYSKQVTPLAYRQLTNTYSQLTSNQRSDKPNGIMWSLPDNSENNLSDPWLTIKPLDSTEFPTSYGKLKDIRTIENEQILARFEKTTALHNTVDMTIDDGKRPESRNLLTAFARRPLVYSETDLGYGGTQSTQSVSCEFGHFHVDPPRGQVIQIAPGGKGMEEISSMIGGKPSGVRNWFKEHLPFKILKSNIKNKENIDTDNAINGVGITMGYDSRFRRVLITKKDYIPKVDCVEYVEGQGFFVNQTLCDETPQVQVCPEGYTFDEETQTCKKAYVHQVCPAGYTYDAELEICTLVVDEVEATCICTADVFATAETICSGATTDIDLTSTETGISYSWTVVQVGATGATSGSGATIAQTLTATGTTAGTATYTVTPSETVDGCTGTPITVVATVNPIPNVIATPSSLTITNGDTAIISLTSNLVGTTYNWTVAQSGVTGANSGTGSTISQILAGEGTATYTITPTNNGCSGTPINVVVTVENVISIPCGGSLNTSGTGGYYEVPVVIGDATGDVTVTFNAENIPDRFQIIWNGNVVADSLFVGDALPNTTYQNNIINATTLNKKLYDGTTFNPNGTITVDYSSIHIANSTGSGGTLRNVGSVGGQVGVVADYPSAGAKASDGDVKLRFNKTTATPNNITVVVIGVETSTGWSITNLECPTI